MFGFFVILLNNPIPSKKLCRFLLINVDFLKEMLLLTTFIVIKY
jgi:hypothetical protein